MIKAPLKDSMIQTLRKGKDAIDEILENGKYDYTPYDLDCSQFSLPDFNSGPKPFYPEQLNKFFNDPGIPKKDRPSIYYFEILDGFDCSAILSAYKSFQDGIGKSLARSSAVLKKVPPPNTNCLYVGKVKKDVAGRMVVHSGYYDKGSTAGLQLCWWAREIKLRLRLHIFHFEPEMVHFVSGLELPLAYELKPLIGTH